MILKQVEVCTFHLHGIYYEMYLKMYDEMYVIWVFLSYTLIMNVCLHNRFQIGHIFQLNSIY